MSMHHWEYAALHKASNPQKDRFWAASLASGSPMSKNMRSSVILVPSPRGSSTEHQRGLRDFRLHLALTIHMPKQWQTSCLDSGGRSFTYHHLRQRHANECSGSTTGTTDAVHQFVAHQLCWLSGTLTIKTLSAVYMHTMYRQSLVLVKIVHIRTVPTNLWFADVYQMHQRPRQTPNIHAHIQEDWVVHLSCSIRLEPLSCQFTFNLSGAASCWIPWEQEQGLFI